MAATHGPRADRLAGRRSNRLFTGDRPAATGGAWSRAPARERARSGWGRGLVGVDEETARLGHAALVDPVLDGAAGRATHGGGEVAGCQRDRRGDVLQ